VAEIRRAALRAADLTRQLLAYGRRQVLAPKVLDLNAVVANLEPMLRRLLGEDLELVADLDDNLGAVRADPSQLEQVILNLVVNARDAMPRGGRLTVATAGIELDPAALREHPGAAPGAYVALDVRDTGTGISPEVRAHLFEPFFTTKAIGKGTGLGLATVYGIVKQSGGFISVTTELGHGTTFRVHLPQVAGQPPAVSPAADDRVKAPDASGTETILIAEDEEAVRRLSRRALERQGYTVLAAPNALEALHAAESHAGAIHLLVTDVVMPGMNGPDLARDLTRLRPDVRVLFMSGYAGEAKVQPFLAKPFLPETLVKRVREVLDGVPLGAPGHTPVPSRPA
jgi:CheY-like chemotaxis protein